MDLSPPIYPSQGPVAFAHTYDKPTGHLSFGNVPSAEFRVGTQCTATPFLSTGVLRPCGGSRGGAG